MASPMVRGASLLILLQLASRLATFAANQLLLRFLTAPLLGAATQLELYYLSVLFFARESLRVAVQRQAPDSAAPDFEKIQSLAVDKTHPEPAPPDAPQAHDDAAQAHKLKRPSPPAQSNTAAAHTAKTQPPKAKEAAQDGSTTRDSSSNKRHLQALINLGHLALLLGLPIAAILAWLYLATTLSSPLANFSLSLRLYALAAIIELVSEPAFILMHTTLRFRVRAAAEAAATALRCAVVFTCVIYAARHHLALGVLPFALGQLAYASALLLVYLCASSSCARHAGFSLLPQKLAPNGHESFVLGYFYRPTVSLASSMMAQSVLKHVLTQGDTLLISLLATPALQGVYALANNYGGLLARLVLQPVEESCRSYFARLLSSSPRSWGPATVSASKRSSAMLEANNSLGTIVRLYLIFSCLVIAIGPFAAPSLLSIVAGSRWTSAGAGSVLSVFCFYIPFLALNGLSESFVASVATERQVHGQSIWMAAFSLVFTLSAFVLMRLFPLGAQGLVLANIVNMLCRIIWSVVFIKNYFVSHGSSFSVTAFLPLSAMVSALATFAMLLGLGVLQETESDPIGTLVKLAGSAVPLVLMITFSERRFLLDCVQHVRGRTYIKQ
ncbi:hypothetical protein CDD82_7827 [Ophiocordyceps australis]|uniref:Man(5)GlcNAc(2)-PP-dolichol translocation protein RFT1 n=1 Tax=Ophiocordyceps australis TaxID=1399860 RepID=A0A2C5YNY6_9HYPO|nr:hypothetical protein CDD82_7827 [Ophiocordyceps australis]